MMDKIIFSEEVSGLFAERVQRNEEFYMPFKHLHREYEIYYLMEGDRYYFINNHTYHIMKGNLVFIDSNQIHKTGGLQTAFHDRILINLSENCILKIENLLVNYNIADFFSKNFGVINLTQEEQDVIEVLFFELQNEMRDKSINYQQSVLLLMARLFILADRYSKTSNHIHSIDTATSVKHEKVNQIAKYIADNYHASISLPILEKEFFISRYYLCRIFKETTGLTVIDYLNLIRIQQAQKHLENTTMSITEIAYSTGFESITYFERVFKKYIGRTPFSYRQKYKVD